MTDKKENKSYKEKLKQITTFIFDVDGVMTNGKLFVLPDGDYVRGFDVKDGYSIQLALKAGYKIIIITGGREESVKVRLSRIGVTDIVMQAREKLVKLEDFIIMYNLKREDMLYLGDDVPDIEPMLQCSIAACPADACTDVKIIANYISPFKGGEGCVRDVIEQVMRCQGTWHKFDTSGFNA